MPGRTPIGECGGRFLLEVRIARRRRGFGGPIAVGRLFSVERGDPEMRDYRGELVLGGHGSGFSLLSSARAPGRACPPGRGPQVWTSLQPLSGYPLVWRPAQKLTMAVEARPDI